MPKPCTMQLAHNADLKHIRPGHTYGLYDKVDGVPGVDHMIDDPSYGVFLTRQKENILSCAHIIAELKNARQRIQERDDINNYMKMLCRAPIVGELNVPGLPFKDAAGIIRRKQGCTDIVYSLFDIQDTAPFDDRRCALALLDMASGDCINRAEHYRDVHIPANGDPQMVLDAVQEIMQKFPEREGVMIRDLSGKYYVGKRSWDMQRVTQTPTIDLRVVGFAEAVSAGGRKLGMVGKVVVSYNGLLEGVGPGKLTHTERRDIWAAANDKTTDVYTDMIAEIKYKRDDTYKGLRQGTFQCWRPDKDVPDA